MDDVLLLRSKNGKSTPFSSSWITMAHQALWGTEEVTWTHISPRQGPREAEAVLPPPRGILRIAPGQCGTTLTFLVSRDRDGSLNRLPEMRTRTPSTRTKTSPPAAYQCRTSILPRIQLCTCTAVSSTPRSLPMHCSRARAQNR